VPVLVNPFLAMAKKGLLDRNVFGLKLSRGEGDPGEIVFGDINHDMFDGELKTLPLLNNTKDLERIQGRWKVSASSISIGGGTASLEGYAALLESDFPLIALPGDLVMLLETHLGMEQIAPYAPKSIDCSKRDGLEDLTLTLGGHDFVISAYEYTIEMEKESWGGHRCISVFLGMPEFIDEKYIIVGSSFLRAFYGVFDLDERTVSCEYFLFYFPLEQCGMDLR
jgi:saccharopepsin